MKKLSDVVIWRKANKISKEVQATVENLDWEESISLKERITTTIAEVPCFIEKGYSEKENLVEALDKAKKASQKARSLVYDSFIENYLTKEDFDYLYNELAHLSSDIGKSKINLLFPGR